MTAPSAFTPCPICAGMEFAVVLSKNGYALARCAACGTMSVNPLPSDEFLRAHYRAPDYFGGDASQGYQNYADMRKALLPHFRRRLRVLGRHFPARGRVLDYGCAAGYFLEAARADGWQIAGVELSYEMAQAASGALGVPVVESLEALAEQDFDAATLWEVIEHLPRPLDTLRELHTRLRPGGALMLSTPNTGHWQAVRAPEKWVGYRPPSHLFYFTQATLVTALRKAGFDRITLYKTFPLPPLPAWLERASAPLQQRLAVGRSDRWQLDLLLWRAVRLFAWGWQKLAHPQDDVFATLEAIAFRPA